MRYSELQVTTNFSFLRGASHPEEMVEQAVLLGYDSLAVTDRNTLAGIVRAHVAAKGKGIRFIPGCQLDLLDGPSLLVYPMDLASYTDLSSLLSQGNLRAEKGICHLYKKDVYAYIKNHKVVVLPPEKLDHHYAFDQEFLRDLAEYVSVFGKNVYLAATFFYTQYDHKRIHRIAQLAERFDIPMVATNAIYYHVAERRPLQDVLTCIREKCTITTAGFRLQQNAERHMKNQEEFQRLFREYPDAIRRTQEIAEACRFSLDELTYVYPEEITNKGRTPQEELSKLTWEGARERFGENIPANIRKSIDYELAFIERKNYASYFLTVQDLVAFARKRDILCQGRGSAANSVVCYCLGISSVDPSHFKLLFARFMSDARDEPPDIDVDFEHERREEVIQYVYEKYGRDRAGIVATVTTVHWKGAVRDVGKVMGLSTDAIDRLAKSKHELTPEWFAGTRPSSQGFDSQDKHLRKVLELTMQYKGFPRQLGQHTGGFVITQQKLSHLCPILHARMQDRTCIEWNKDDIEALGFLKVDVLALGMLTCIRKGFDLAKQHYGLDLTLADIPQGDKEVYQMISLADTLGVFQIESRAQMSMLPRLKPKGFYDLVIEVAIVRPGPIQGDMVHPYLRRREGLEPVDYPSQELEDILGRTLGVPLFQEQAMEIAIVAAGFTPAEADGLRRSMATFKSHGKVSAYEQKLVQGMVAKGYEEAFAKRVFRQLEGFGSYGFPESHAASFALLVYISSYIKCHYPDIFAASLLNSQPMGFYSPAQIIIDARRHGVEVRPVDVNHSTWDYTLEEKVGKYCAVRLGFRQVKGVSQNTADRIVQSRKGGYRSINALMDAGVTQAAMERLADADAFRSLGLDRREALWHVAALRDHPQGLFLGRKSESAYEDKVVLPAVSAMEHVIQDYATTTLSLKAHPVSFIRNELEQLQVMPTQRLDTLQNGAFVKVCGLVTVRQRPGTAKGVLFITVEDETGFANLVVWSSVFAQYRTVILQSKLLLVTGQLQVEGKVIHVVVKSCHNLTGLMKLPAKSRDIGSIASNKSARQEGSQGELFPSRDFK